MANNPFDYSTQTSQSPLSKSSPFEQAFRAGGLGGQAQQARITQLGKKKEETAQTAQMKMQGEREKLMAKLAEKKMDVYKDLSEQRQEMGRAREFAQEDVRLQVDQMMRQRQMYIEDISRQRDEMRDRLQDVVSEEALAREMQAYNDVIGGLTRGAMALDNYLQARPVDQPAPYRERPIPQIQPGAAPSLGYRPFAPQPQVGPGVRAAPSVTPGRSPYEALGGPGFYQPAPEGYYQPPPSMSSGLLGMTPPTPSGLGSYSRPEDVSNLLMGSGTRWAGLLQLGGY